MFLTSRLQCLCGPQSVCKYKQIT